MNTQTDRVISYLKGKGSITPMEAWNELGIYRLSARILDARKQGFRIEAGRVDVMNRFGEKCSVAEYRMAEQKLTQGELI